VRVLITRPKEDSAKIQRELAARGIDSQLDPMLRVHPLENVSVDLAGAQGLLFTSSNGVRSFARRSERRDMPAYCVGDETARTARAEEFREVHSAAGNVDRLAEYVAGHARPEKGRMIHIAGSVSAGNLAGALRDAGFAVDRVPLYEAVAATALGEETREAIEQKHLDAALFFSPRTAATFVSLVKSARLEGGCRAIDAYCLSAAVAHAVAGLPWRHIFVAAQPTRAAMLAALDQG